MNEARSKDMKVRRILVLIAAAALAQLGYAKPAGEHRAAHPTPVPRARPQGPNYAQLGAEQAVLDFCSRVDSGDAKQYGAQAKTLFAGIREDSLETARGNSQYKNAYATIGSAIGQIPLPEAVQGCKDIIATASPAKASGKSPAGNTSGNNAPAHTSGHGASKGFGERVKETVRK
jgi:hypothetical protein